MRNETAEPEIRTIASSVVYADEWIRLRKDDIERGNGTRGTYAVVERRDFALIIPAERGGFHLVEEYRYPVGRRSWSFPQGGFPHGETGTPEELARLELVQETGLRAGRLTHLGSLTSGHGLTNQYGIYFLATDLTAGEADLEPEEYDLRHAWVPRERFEAMIQDGQIVDDSTLAGYALLLLAERRGVLTVPLSPRSALVDPPRPGYPPGVDRLTEYRGKRDPSRTPEPVPDKAGTPDGPGQAAGIFVIQEHHARRLHWDFRLERDGVLVSWALPKGVPDDPAVNHLAVHTEDHPMEYATFHGQIPRGEYGAGSVTIWDHGTYEAAKWTDHEVKVTLHGERVTGGYVLFATGGKNWMIHRERLPLPASLRPMLATIGRPPAGDLGNWAVEMKWDGVRALAFAESGRLRLGSRTGRDITATYPELAGLAHAISRKQALADGEIVAFTDGRPDFEALQSRMHVSSPAQAVRLAERTPVTYLAFDVLQLDGRPLGGLPYSERRALLEDFFPNERGWLAPPHFPGEDLDDVLTASAATGLEGVVAKRLDSRYEPGARTGSWRKIKNQLRQEVVVAGWKPGKGNRTGLIGSLLVGVHGDEGLIYCGHVGTGFSDATLRMLGRKLGPLRRAGSPFARPVPAEDARHAVWVEPRLVAEVAFDRWTRAGRMRAPVYLGLRDDKDPADVVRET